MIVRVLEEGQYEVGEESAARLRALDESLDDAMQSDDEEAFDATLRALVAEVHSSGRLLEPSALVPSDAALPAPGTSLAEMRKLLEAGAEAAPGAAAR